jgi:membrane-associated protein
LTTSFSLLYDNQSQTNILLPVLAVVSRFPFTKNMSIINWFFDFILHLDIHLGQIISTYGAATYAILFTVIFIETGLVITPFLPGDSLLFVAGAFAALGSLNIFWLIILLSLAAILGDTANYWIGRYLGEKAAASRWFPVNEKQLAQTQAFFQKHGGKTIILARFIPVIRTFAPFVAGAGRMNYTRFLSYNILGGILWVCVGTIAGYYFGNIPFVKDNFSFFIIGIVLVSFIPILIQILKSKSKSKGKNSESKAADSHHS